MFKILFLMIIFFYLKKEYFYDYTMIIFLYTKTNDMYKDIIFHFIP